MRWSRLLLLGLLPACATPEDASPVIGVFDVALALEQNECGYGAVPIPSVTRLETTLRGYPDQETKWQFTGQSPVSGYATPDGTYHFETRSRQTLWSADPLYGTCILETRVAITAKVTPLPVRSDAGMSPDAGESDAGSTPSYTLAGDYSMDIYPTLGSTCAPLLGSNGGTYGKLPCRVTADLTGTQAH